MKWKNIFIILFILLFGMVIFNLVIVNPSKKIIKSKLNRYFGSIDREHLSQTKNIDYIISCLDSENFNELNWAISTLNTMNNANNTKAIESLKSKWIDGFNQFDAKEKEVLHHFIDSERLYLAAALYSLTAERDYKIFLEKKAKEDGKLGELAEELLKNE